jgi:hypothetical protein
MICMMPGLALTGILDKPSIPLKKHGQPSVTPIMPIMPIMQQPHQWLHDLHDLHDSWAG